MGIKRRAVINLLQSCLLTLATVLFILYINKSDSCVQLQFDINKHFWKPVGPVTGWESIDTLYEKRNPENFSYGI